MSTIFLPSVEKAVEKTLELLSSGANVSLTGPFGAGKSTALLKLEEHLKANQRRVMRLAFPWGDDAACAVVADVCDAAGSRPSPGAPLLTQLDAALDTLRPSDYVLLLDEPRVPHEGDVTLFDERAQLCVERLLDWGREASVVVAQRMRSSSYVPQAKQLTEVRVDRAANPQEVLAKADLLSAPGVAQLLARRGTELSRCSPIEIRLAAVAAQSQDRAVRRVPLELRALLDLVTDQVTDGMRRALASLALLREELTQDWLDWATSRLSDHERKLICTVFLFGDEGSAPRLHESIAIHARLDRWMSAAETENVHREIADLYLKKFALAATKSWLPQTLRAEVECIHHRTLGADSALLHDSLFFVEQYDMLGRVFGARGQELWAANRVEARASLKNAIDAYTRALEHDPTDWYALHYRAFNRDALGGDVRLIGPDYERVVNELRPDFVWGHSRYARWLITCGRLREAREAFARASRELVSSTSREKRVFEELHIDVARQALEYGHHAFASEVLTQVPERWRSELQRYDALDMWAHYQSEIEQGQTVFPPWIAANERWNRPRFAQRGEHIDLWYPGVVTAQSGELWRFRIAFKSDSFGWREVTLAELSHLGFDAGLRHLPVGTFVEFITVSNRERIEVYPSLTRDPFENQRVRFPDPRRYLTNEQG
jgi:tetratricopeptide (TPR) repeat protein